MAGTHKILSPSAASRWSRCLGSLAMSKGIPNTSNSFADEGTAYHYVAEQALNQGKYCADWIDKQILVTDETVMEMPGEAPFGRTFIVDAENAAHAQKYVDHISARAFAADFYTEVKIDLSALLGVEDQGGTSDAVVLDTSNQTLEVHDLKFGKGEIVFAFTAPDLGQPRWMGANEQLLLYAAGALLKYIDVCKWQFVKIVIHQPRIYHYDEATFSRVEVREFIRYMAERAKIAYSLYSDFNISIEDAESFKLTLTPGEKQCRWCPRRGNCPARNNEMMAMFPLMPAGQQLIETGGITNRVQKIVNPTPVLWSLSEADIAAALDRVSDIEKWCKDIKAEAHSRALSGKELPGWKLVTGRKGNRAWEKDAKIVDDDPLFGETETPLEEFLVMTLGQAAYEKPSIISVPAAEKLMKRFPERWAQLQAIITQPDGHQTLAPINDPRPAAEATPVQFGLTDEFTN